MYTAIVLANIMLLTSGLIQIEPYKQQILDVHNNFRRQLKATNMNKLIWDEKLEERATKWIKHCILNTPLTPAVNVFARLFMGNPDYKSFLDIGMKSWFNEGKSYIYRYNKCSGNCKGYKEMVTANYKYIGCAMSKCAVRGMESWTSIRNLGLVCLYGPLAFPFRPYYLGGKACAWCKDSRMCDRGLCAENCFDMEEICTKEVNTKFHCKMSDSKFISTFAAKICRKSCGYCSNQNE